MTRSCRPVQRSLTVILDSRRKHPDQNVANRFAAWITGKDNPLTARVMANRIWHHVFGRGIVSTTSDFGKAGAPPTHPELLDWLAAEFMEPTAFAASGTDPMSKPWSMKSLIRMLVTSDAFRQSSRPTDAGMAKDAGSGIALAFPAETSRSGSDSRFRSCKHPDRSITRSAAAAIAFTTKRKRTPSGRCWTITDRKPGVGCSIKNECAVSTTESSPRSTSPIAVKFAPSARSPQHRCKR